MALKSISLVGLSCPFVALFIVFLFSSCFIKHFMDRTLIIALHLNQTATTQHKEKLNVAPHATAEQLKKVRKNQHKMNSRKKEK